MSVNLDLVFVGLSNEVVEKVLSHLPSDDIIKVIAGQRLRVIGMFMILRENNVLKREINDLFRQADNFDNSQLKRIVNNITDIISLLIKNSNFLRFIDSNIDDQYINYYFQQLKCLNTRLNMYEESKRRYQMDRVLRFMIPFF